MQSTDSLLNAAMFGKMLFGLLLVFGLIGLLVIALRLLQRKRLALTGALSDLKVIQNTHIGPKQKLSVVIWGHTQYLIGMTPNGGFLVDKRDLPAPKTTEKESKKNA